MGRQSMLIKHIFIAFKDHYPGCQGLLPKEVSYMESVLTALMMLVNTDDENILSTVL